MLVNVYFLDEGVHCASSRYCTVELDDMWFVFFPQILNHYNPHL